MQEIVGVKYQMKGVGGKGKEGKDRPERLGRRGYVRKEGREGKAGNKRPERVGGKEGYKWEK